MTAAPLSGGHVKRVDAILMLKATKPVRFAERVMVRVVVEIPSHSYHHVEFPRQIWNLGFCCVVVPPKSIRSCCFLMHHILQFFHSAPWLFIR
jgi:hypothetical protein